MSAVLVTAFLVAGLAAPLAGDAVDGDSGDGELATQDAESPQAPRRLLVVDLDDLGWEFLNESEIEEFTALDEAARTYRNFHTAPLCSPTRSLMQMGAFGSHPDLLLGGLIREQGTFEMPTEGPLEPLAKVVSSSGRRTAKVGKWHLAPYTVSDHPNRAGWQDYVGVMGNTGGDAPFFRWAETKNGVVTRGRTGYLTTAETDQALEFVERDVDLISVSYHAIHDPYHAPPKELVGELDESGETILARAMLRALGRELARLTERALERGYTIVVFSDNGALEVLGGAKGSLGQYGTLVPLWVLGPGVEPGEDRSLVGAVDLYRTILEFFAIEASPTRGPDSVSFLGTWKGEPGARELLFFERFDKNGVDPRLTPDRWGRAVRDERYLLMLTPHKPHQRLFDLDPRGRWGNLLRGKLAKEEQPHFERLRDELFRISRVPWPQAAPTTPDDEND